MPKLSLKIPPVPQGLIAFLLMWLLARYAPVYRLDIPYGAVVSSLLFGLGGLVGLLSVATFIRLRTTVDPRYPDKAAKLVVQGLYKYSRNPMYLAIVLALTGIALRLGALSAWAVVPLFAAFITRYQIVPEEKALGQKFGDDYRNYARRVRRWV